MSDEKLKLNPSREAMVNLFVAMYESIESDPEAVRQCLEEEGVDVDEFVRKEKEHLSTLLSQIDDGPSHPNDSLPRRFAGGVFQSLARFTFSRYLRVMFKRIGKLRRKLLRIVQQNKIRFVSKLRVFSRRLGRTFLAGTPGTVLLLIGFVAVLLPGYTVLLLMKGWGLLASILISTAAILGIWCVGGLLTYNSLRHLPPEEYARTVMDGYPVTRSLQLVSHAIWKLCRRFVKNQSTVCLEKFADQLLQAISKQETDPILSLQKHRIGKHVQRLAGMLLRQDASIQRVIALKKFSAKQLHLPEQQVCDYLYQFSPTLFRNRVAKYISNWEEILNMDAYHSADCIPVLRNRLKAILLQNKSILQKTTKRMQYQTQLFTYTDLHSHIQGFVSDASISGAVRQYAQAISCVAHQALSELRPGQTENRRQLTAMLQEVWNRLQFLYYKQRAREGFDLHYTCYRICKTAAAGGHSVPHRRENQIALLEGLMTNPDHNPFNPDPLPALRELQDLSHLFETVTIVVEQCRDNLIETFRGFYDTWLDGMPQYEPGPARLIITHDYSKTVREVLKRVVLPLGGKQSVIPEVACPKIFIVKSRQEEASPAKLMMYELKEGGFRQELKNTFSGVDKLMSGAKIMILIGAECFDRDRWVFHPGGIGEYIQGLRKLTEQQDADLLVVVVAESYKCHDRLVELPEFYQDRFDRLSLYEPGMIDVIVTNSDIITANTAASSKRYSDDLLSTMLRDVRTY